MTTNIEPAHALLNTCFRSGMSSRSDLRGAMDAGVPVGVVVGHLTTLQLVAAIPRYVDQGHRVFVDSGAFSEVTSGASMDWRDVMSRYKTLAEMADHPKNLYLVAPDKVGDQAASLERLLTWRDQVVYLIQLGARIIVPIQAGALPANEMLERVKAILGTADFVVGIPSNRAAMSLEECAALRHPAYHILGRVHYDKDQIARIAALREASPDADISADANWLRSRLAGVQKGVDEIRAQRQCGNDAAGGFSFDHPRVEAVRRAIQMDASWGREGKPIGFAAASLMA